MEELLNFIFVIILLLKDLNLLAVILHSYLLVFSYLLSSRYFYSLHNILSVLIYLFDFLIFIPSLKNNDLFHEGNARFIFLSFHLEHLNMFSILYLNVTLLIYALRIVILDSIRLGLDTGEQKIRFSFGLTAKMSLFSQN